MALSSSVLKGMIVDNMATEFGTPEEPDKVEKMANAIAKAVVDHIQAAAVCTLNSGTDDNGDNLLDKTGAVG